MVKVGIVTIIDYANFGNRLQNFALQEAIRSLAYDVVTVKNSPIFGEGLSPARRRMEILRTVGVRAFADKARRFGPQRPSHPHVRMRFDGNLDFSGRVPQTSQNYQEIEDIEEFAQSFAFFVVGSDQVWNPEFRHLNGVDFLTFARESQRVAYAASVGLAQLPPRAIEVYRSHLQGIPSISVREFEAADLVHQMIGRHVPVVLDPTMLLDAAYWRRMATAPSGFPRDGYIAKFQLGVEDARRAALVEGFARKHDLQIVDINDLESRSYCTSPLDFLAIIDGAELVVTDSFHAAVFSTLFQTPFLRQERGEMNSRLNTLMQKVGLKAGEWNTSSEIEAFVDVDWGAVQSRVDRERVHSMEFLTRALARG